MRFQGLITSAQPTNCQESSRLGLLEKVSRLMDDATRSGALTSANCEGAKFARVKLAAGKFTVTGSGSAEPKSAGASYAMFDVDSIMEAILWTKCFLQVLGEGECEIHPLCAA
jgi:hypothetical protein